MEWAATPHDAAAVIAERAPGFTPRVGIVLGSGLGGLADRIGDAVAISYADLPGFPRPGVHGHAGRLVLAGGEITGLSPRAIARRGVGRTFQVTATFGSMTLRENVQLALLAREREVWRFWRPLAAWRRTGGRGAAAAGGFRAQRDLPGARR